MSKKILLLLLGLAGLASSVFAVEFEVQGNAIYDLYSGTSLESSRTNSFVVSVHDAEWEIITWPLGSSNRLESDKDASYLRTAFNEFKGWTNSKPIWSNVGFKESGTKPSFEDPFLQTLWLTYCSSAYLQSITNGKIEPIWPMDNPYLLRQGFRLSSKWHLDEDAPHLPNDLIYLNDGIYRGYNFSKKQPIEIKLHPPYNLGYTCAVFTATSITNLNGMDIPLEFSFRTSQTPLGNHTPDMPRDVMIGEVQNIKTSSSVVSFLPAYQGEISIHDFVIVDKLPNITNSSIHYKAYNGEWPQGDKLRAYP